MKYKSTEELSILGDYEQFELSEMDGEGEGRQFELYENISQFIENYENARKEKKSKKAAGLEKFVDEDPA